MAGLLALGPRIVERLQTALPDNVHVFQAKAADDFTRAGQFAPAVVVCYDGGAVPESRPDGRAVRIGQRWACLAIARNLVEIPAGAAALADAGDLADLVLEHLLGWQPEATSQPFKLQSLPQPRYDTGYQIVPLIFTTEFVRKSPA